MAKLNDTGVYQLTNKNWAFRYTITADGRKKDVRKAKDEFGNPLKTKTEAIRARNKAVEREREGKKPAPKVRKSFKEVYEEYCGNGRREPTEPNKSRTAFGIITFVRNTASGSWMKSRRRRSMIISPIFTMWKVFRINTPKPF